MYIICIIEEKPKIFSLLKDIVSDMCRGKCIFLEGNMTLSKDAEKDFEEDSVIIFQRVTYNTGDIDKFFENADFVNLAFVGDISGEIDIGRLNGIDSVIINAENLNKIKNAEKSNQVITCGLKEKDTVTFSSIEIEDDNIILNVQRTIKNIKNADIEPLEKKIYIENILSKESSEAQHEDLITSLAILLFCDLL